MNLTSFGIRSKPLFSNYIKPYIVVFQNTQKILRENIQFTRNSESKMEFFSQKILKSIFFYWGFFLALIFEF